PWRADRLLRSVRLKRRSKPTAARTVRLSARPWSATAARTGWTAAAPLPADRPGAAGERILSIAALPARSAAGCSDARILHLRHVDKLPLVVVAATVVEADGLVLAFARHAHDAAAGCAATRTTGSDAGSGADLRRGARRARLRRRCATASRVLVRLTAGALLSHED